MSNKLFLYVSTSVEIQMEIDHCGLRIIMAKSFLYLGYRLALIEQIDCSRMTE